MTCPNCCRRRALIPNRTSTTTARPLERCHENNGWRTGVSGLASYTIPKIDVLVSGTYPESAGSPAQRERRQLPCARQRRSDARSPARRQAAASTSFRPVRCYIERLNQIDFRVAKLFRFNGHHANEHQLRLLQRHELELGADRERDVRRRVENTAVDPAAAPVQAQRAVRLLNEQGRSFRGPALTFAVTQDSKRKTQTLTARAGAWRSVAAKHAARAKPGHCLSFAF